MTRYVDGARARAEELGYGFDEIHCAKMGMGARLQKILFSRGIRGVIVGSQGPSSPKPALDWSQLATVAQSYTTNGLKASRSLNNYYLSMRTAMAELRALGYRRIGYASPLEVEGRTDQASLSAYLGVQAGLDPEERVSVLTWSGSDRKPLAKWLEQERPDALLLHDVRIRTTLADLGVRVPDDLGLAWLSLHPEWQIALPEFQGLAGIDQRLERCGSVAVDLLVSRLSQNELGLPEEPVLALTEGVWIPGPTVRAAGTVPDVVKKRAPAGRQAPSRS
jgi:LacI family transcriptional regulator